MLIKYQIRNNFESVTAQTATVSGGTTGLYKSISIPINMEFLPVDYGEDVQDIVLAERQKAKDEILRLDPFNKEVLSLDFSNVP